MEPDDLVEVYSTNNANMAEIIRNALQAEGIPCQISGSNQALLAGLDAMEIGLVVRQADYERADAFIQDHLEKDLDDTDIDDEDEDMSE